MSTQAPANRQSSTPVQFTRTARVDTSSLMSSGRAGESVMFAYAPILRGDSCSGSISVDLELGDLPRPIVNGVVCNVQAWYVPKSIHPQFSGHDEFLASYQGETITALGQPDRQPPGFYTTFTSQTDLDTIADSKMYKTLGLHIGPVGSRRPVNSDLIDSYQLVQNFRLAAHSSFLQLQPYASENLAAATDFGAAFWPSGRYARLVADYESALITGSLDLDMLAGSMPVLGITRAGTTFGPEAADMQGFSTTLRISGADPANRLDFGIDQNGLSSIRADIQGETIATSLADIDKARTTQAFAKLRNSMKGNQTTGFNMDDAIMAELMSGYTVPPEMLHRPVLLDSKRVPFGFNQRFSTDSAQLDASLSRGVTSVELRVNVPSSPSGGMIIALIEVLPELLYERQSDEMLHHVDVAQLPDALRDIQRTEPVDQVLAGRIDTMHTTPDVLYGYEPMNNVYNRETTRLGGDYYQADPGNPFQEQRSAIWLANIVDPLFTQNHWLAPQPFPHDVFSDTLAPAFEMVSRTALTFTGITQMGDMLSEANDDYGAVAPPSEVTPT